MPFYDVTVDKIVCLSNQQVSNRTGAQASLPARRGFRGVSASVVESQSPLRRGSHGVQARMPALQSVPDFRIIRDSSHIYRVRHYPRDFIERRAEIVAIDFDTVDSDLLRIEADPSTFRRV